MEEIIKPNTGGGGGKMGKHIQEKKITGQYTTSLGGGGGEGMWGRGRELATVRGSLSESIFHHVTF